MAEPLIIGRAERADFPELGIINVPAKIDTGADACSIWAKATEVEHGRLHVVFFGPGSELYTGEEHIFERSEYATTRVSNSFGHKEVRYKLKLAIRIRTRLIRGSFSLSDRSQKLYPILIGRSLLRGKFLVDVRKGNPLRAAERVRARRLKRDMEALKGEHE